MIHIMVVYDFDLRFSYCDHENSAFRVPYLVLELHIDVIQREMMAN